MDNDSYVCFRCRRVVRRPAHQTGAVPCSSCAEPTEWIGDRVPVPPRDNVRAWAALEESWREAREESRRVRAVEQVRQRHAIEQRIAELEARGDDSKERTAQVAKLRQRLRDDFPTS